MTFEILATGIEFINKGFKGTKPEIERLVKNARETIFHNHRLNDQVNKFKSFYRNFV